MHERIRRRQRLFRLGRAGVCNRLDRGGEVLLVVGDLVHDVRQGLHGRDVVRRVLVRLDVGLLYGEAAAFLIWEGCLLVE